MLFLRCISFQCIIIIKLNNDNTKKETKRVNERQLANLMLCTVRLARDVERRFCFEVVSPFDAIILQAENEDNLQEWMHAIQNAIADQLNSNRTSKTQVQPGEKVDPLLLQLRQVHESNNYCCDCGAPRLFSLNLIKNENNLQYNHQIIIKLIV